MGLPSFVVLKSNSNGKYLCPVVVGDSQAQTYVSLQFSGENVFDLSAKYEVEAADNGFVHIRSCYNNKYWARRAEDDHRILVQAKEPEIDCSNWSCTLFKPIINARTVRFHHVQLNRCVSIAPTQQGGETEEVSEYEFTNWESLLVLPRHVAFKANDSCYLSVSQTCRYNCFPCIFGDNGHNYMQFTGNDFRDQTVRNDIFVTDEGYVRIMSRCHKSFWRRDPSANWIWADSSDNDPAADDLFWPVKISDNEIALRSKGNNLYCGRNGNNCLRASAVSIIRDAYLLMEETVLSRRIQIVKFHPGIRESRANIEVHVSNEIINYGRRESVTTLTFSHSNTRSRTWSSSISRRLGGQTTITVTVPINLQLKLGISGEISRAIEWGEREEISDRIEVTKSITVPPRTAIKVIVTGLEHTLEVPFSYIQSDTLTDGTSVTYQNDHGIYIQKKYFKFKQLIQERNIDD